MELECKAQETAYNEKTDKADFSVAPKGNAEQEREFWLSVKYSDTCSESERS